MCKGAEKLLFTVTRAGLSESFLRKTTYSGVASYCPNCGRPTPSKAGG